MRLPWLVLVIDANDPVELSRFWSGLLGWDATDGPDGDVTLFPCDETSFAVRFRPSEQPKVGRNQMHFDLTSRSLEDQRRVVVTALGLGGRHNDIGQGYEVPHIVLADPEGNEFCVIEPGNSFLTDCGFMGAVACDGTREVGYFWSAALGWPLVWDQDEETAIRSPRGGPKITWGGPPVAPKRGRNRLRFDVSPAVGTHQQAEVDRLVSLGATRIGTDQARDGRVEMSDPDGNEFAVIVRDSTK